MPINFYRVPTACFVLEEARLRRNLETLQYVQEQSGAQIILALKGFAMFSTFGLIRQYLHGTTASSLYEARLGYEEFGDEVHAYAPAYFESEFEELMGYCNHITFNSPPSGNGFVIRFSRTIRRCPAPFALTLNTRRWKRTCTTPAPLAPAWA